MNEPWISNIWLVGGILGSIMGFLGALFGSLGGLVNKGKAKKLVLGYGIFGIILSFIILVIGVVAYLFGQPGVWWCFGFPGILGAVVFTPIFFGFRYEYRKAELRKSMSEDLTFSRNKEDKEISDE